MVDAEILRRRIDALLDYVSRLEPFGGMDRQRFIENRNDHHLAERYLHLAIESALDIANHLIAEAGFEAPDTYRDAFAILARHGVLDNELGKRLQSWAGSCRRRCSRPPSLITPVSAALALERTARQPTTVSAWRGSRIAGAGSAIRAPRSHTKNQTRPVLAALTQ